MPSGQTGPDGQCSVQWPNTHRMSGSPVSGRGHSSPGPVMSLGSTVHEKSQTPLRHVAPGSHPQLSSSPRLISQRRYGSSPDIPPVSAFASPGSPPCPPGAGPPSLPPCVLPPDGPPPESLPPVPAPPEELPTDAPLAVVAPDIPVDTVPLPPFAFPLEVVAPPMPLAAPSPPPVPLLPLDVVHAASNNRAPREIHQARADIGMSVSFVSMGSQWL